MAVGTRDALVLTAEHLMRTKGYAAFSYADLAETVGIRKASIHHHFPTKEDLGTAIVEEYIDRVHGEFTQIELQHEAAIPRLEAFFRLFRASSDGGMLPLCGALAAEMSALPVGLQQLTYRFLNMQLKWLEAVIEQGMEREEFPRGVGAKQKAFVLLSMLEGSSFINWATKAGDPMDGRMVQLIVQES
jgi:TetR/AcrR family transcriptional repressor of nem operon